MAQEDARRLSGSGAEGDGIGMTNRDDFAEMIRDWKADNSPEMDDLIIDEIKLDDGKWVALAHDDAATYSLTDDGTGKIVINYLGA